MNALKRRLIDEWQGGFPLCERPFAVMAERLESSEDAVLEALRELLADGTLTRFGPLYQVERLGGAFSLAALKAREADFDRIASAVNGFPEVAHNYRREHAFNMWFVLATETPAGVGDTIERIAMATGLPVFDFPKEREYVIETRFTVGARRAEGAAAPTRQPSSPVPLPLPEREVCLVPMMRPLLSRYVTVSPVWFLVAVIKIFPERSRSVSFPEDELDAVPMILPLPSRWVVVPVRFVEVVAMIRPELSLVVTFPSELTSERRTIRPEESRAVTDVLGKVATSSLVSFGLSAA